MPTKDNVTSQQFDRRISIQAPTRTSDGQGGETVVWNTVYTCWADIQNFPHGRGLFRHFMAQQLYPQVNTIIAIRYQADYHVDATMRIVYVKGPLTHPYQILGIENPSEANVSLLFYCQENQAMGFN